MDPPARDLVAAVRDRVGSVLIVDDGLGAPARRALTDLARECGVDVARSPGPRGKGHALATGIRTVLARRPSIRAVLTVDADGQHPPERIPAFLDAAAEAELVVGDRFGELAHMPADRRLANRLACLTLQVTTGEAVRDTQCGMRLLAGRALHEVHFGGGGYEAEARHLKQCLRAGVSVAWVPIPAIYEGAPSSFRRARDTARVAAALLR